MKNKSLIITTMFIFLAAGIFAQPNKMQQNKKAQGMFMNIPDLTDAQKTKLKEMRTAHMKEIMPIKNQLKEKQAHLQTLQTSDKVNMTEINATIDEIGKLRTDMAKKHAAFRQEIRKILTDDQRTYYDMHAGKMHKKMMKRKPGCNGMQK